MLGNVQAQGVCATMRWYDTNVDDLKGERRSNTVRRLFLVVVVLVLAGIACSLGGDSAEIECPPVEECEPEIVEVTRIVTQIVESELIGDKTPGIYLVNLEIAPGVWRSDGGGDKCYWSITDQTGDIIDSSFGLAEGAISIPPYAYQVELKKGCGTWHFLQP